MGNRSKTLFKNELSNKATVSYKLDPYGNVLIGVIDSTTETSFVQLLHILAHHPDFTVATDDLVVFMQYFEFYLSCVATPENVSFLYHVAQKIKSSKDMVSHELSQVNC